MEVINPTNLDLAITLPTLALADAAGLKAWALGVKEKYAGLVILEEQTVGAKAEIAELRRIAKQLNDSRIAAVRQVSAPIKTFEDQIKEVTGIFLETADGIDSQVKNYEAQAREQKRVAVLFAIEALTEEAGYPGLNIPVQESWLNKSQKDKATAAEIKAIIADHIKAERDAAALEQAKKDRAEAIEDTLAALAERHGFTIPASQFLRLQSLEVTWAEVRDALFKAFDMKAEAMKRENVAPPPPTLDVFGRKPLDAPAQRDVEPLPLVRASDVPTVREGLTIHVEYDTGNILAVRDALASLEACCLDFIWHKKPLANTNADTSHTNRPARNY